MANQQFRRRVVKKDDHVHASKPRKQRSALIAHYALSDVTTFYTRHGDWLAYLCAIISIGALLMRVVAGRVVPPAGVSGPRPIGAA